MERILFWIMAFCLMCMAYFRSRRVLDRLKSHVSRLKEYKDGGYPEAELHPLLRRARTEPAKRPVRRADNTLSQLPDPEEEKDYPYYNRTGQILCDAQKYSVQSLKDHTWYGYMEWVQDWICGHADSRLFEQENNTEGRDQKNGAA